MRHLTNRIAVMIIISTLAITLMAMTISVLPEMLFRGTSPLVPELTPVGVTLGRGCHGVRPELETMNWNILWAGCTPGASRRYSNISVLFP